MLDVFDYRASDLIGATVLDDRGESVAKVDDIVVSTEDDKLHAVLAIGGFLGFGAKLITIPLDDLQITSERRQSAGAYRDDRRATGAAGRVAA